MADVLLVKPEQHCPNTSRGLDGVQSPCCAVYGLGLRSQSVVSMARGLNGMRSAVCGLDAVRARCWRSAVGGPMLEDRYWRTHAEGPMLR